jgi:ATP-dependent protease ClpP protease subunit
VLTSALADEERIDKILRERAAIPDDVLARRRGMEVFFTADEARKFGLVHELADFTLPPGNQIFQL